MTVRDIMTKEPTCCTADMPLPEVARMMADHDCGEIPVVDSVVSRVPIGVITDRDITIRAVAQNRNPLDSTVGECMTQPAVVIEAATSVDECCKLLESEQIRRVPVVDQKGRIVGIVSQADIARRVSNRAVGQVVFDVSKPPAAARVASA
jgi:CBS domain-containing protein